MEGDIIPAVQDIGRRRGESSRDYHLTPFSRDPWGYPVKLK